jgi:hypothetical protein
MREDCYFYSTRSNTPFVIPFQFSNCYIIQLGVIDLSNNQYVCQVEGSLYISLFKCGFNVTKASFNTVQLQFSLRRTRNELNTDYGWLGVTVEFGGNSTASLLINDAD